MFSLIGILAFILFGLESFHFVGHCLIMFRVRQLPRKDFVRMRFYFLVDTLTVFLSSFVVLGTLQWLTSIQLIQHLYYYLMWEKTDTAKKIVSWSSLDWTRSTKYEEWHIWSIIGTLFDVFVHMVMGILLSQQLTTVQIISSLLIAQSWLIYVLNVPKYAWSSPWATPEWVEKRIKPLDK
ncbi:uncharacterized protein LOC134707245 [Mytilus trossulus]|uniref:uncharacterized protein LOC134707245 n=1 Tax=Mytilus trossulus TaxID=6551 RepID=UPI003003C704